MDQERTNAMAKALLDMEMLERTTTGGRRYVAERLLAADDAWRAAHAPEPASTAAGDALAEATRNYLRVSTQYAINRVAGVPPSERDDVESALAAYRSAAPAPNFAPATDEEIGQAVDTYCSTPGLEAAFRVMLNGLIRARSLPARSAEATAVVTEEMVQKAAEAHWNSYCVPPTYQGWLVTSSHQREAALTAMRVGLASVLSADPSASPAANPWTQEQVEALVRAQEAWLLPFSGMDEHKLALRFTPTVRFRVLTSRAALDPFAALAEQDGDNAPPVLAPQPGEAPAAGAPAPVLPYEFNGRFYTNDQWDHAAGQPEWLSAEQSKQGDAPTPAILAGAELLRTLRTVPAPDRLAELARAAANAWRKSIRFETWGARVDVPAMGEAVNAHASMCNALADHFDAFAADRRGQVR